VRQLAGELLDEVEPAMLRVGDHGDGLGLGGPRLLVGIHLDAEDRPLGVGQQVHGSSPQAQPGLDLASREQDLGPDSETVGERAHRLVRPRRRRLLQPLLRLVDGAELQVGEHQPPPDTDHVRPGPESLQHRQHRQQVAPCLVTPFDLQAQLADPAVGGRLQVRDLPVLEGFERAPGGLQRAFQVALVLPEVADDGVGGAGHQQLVAVAQLVQSRAIFGRGVQHDRDGAGQGVRRGRRQSAQGHQRAHRAGPLDGERVGGAHRQGRPGDLDEFGLGPEVRQHPGGLLDQRRQAWVVGLDGPKAPEHGGGRRDRGAVRHGEPVTERLYEVVLLVPDPLNCQVGIGPERRMVVGHPEVARPRQEAADRAAGLTGRLQARRAELPHGLEYPEPGARRGVHHLEQRLVDQVLQDL
jgi:hypothetical protein